MILGGAAKSNKSFVTLNICLALAKGQSIFDAHYKNQTPVFPVTKSWKVLMFEQEIGAEGLQKRLKSMVSIDESFCEFYVRSKDLGLQLDTVDGLANIEREIDSVMPDVLVIDPLSKMHTAEENSSQEMGNVMRRIDYLINKYGLSILVVHHTGNAAFDPQNMRRGGARLRGSSAIFADVDSYLEVANLSGPQSLEPTLKLSFELRQGEPLRAQFVQRTRSGRIIYKGEDAPLAGGS